ncbi:MAG: hypothetical protein ABJB49_00650 [Nitrospirota bacterium]
MAGMAGFGWAMDQLGSGTTLLGIGVILLVAALVATYFSRLLQPVQPAALVSPAS